MAKAKPLSYYEWVDTLVKKVSAYFDFAGWEISIEAHNDEVKGDSYAETSINGPYQYATIHLYKQAKQDFDNGSLKQLIQSLIHELVHIFLDPFHNWSLPHLSETTKPYFINILEQQTQRLTMVFLKNLPKGLIPPR